MRTADYRLLPEAMTDWLHESYRLARLAGLEDILLEAKQAGVSAAALSDTSPGAIAFAKKGHAEIQRAMDEIANNKRMEARGFVLRISNHGAEGEDQPCG